MLASHGNCWKCNDELLPNAKFCIECGSAVKRALIISTPPQDVEMSAEPLASPSAEVEVGQPKKQFQAKEAPKCAVCGRNVYRMEEAQDSAGLVFHKECFRCKTCKVFLHGRERVVEPESGISVKIANGMYLVAKEKSHLGNKGDFFCDKHSIKARGEVVKAQDIDERYLDESELKRVASMRKDQNEEAKQSMQSRVGDMIPVCSRCSRPIDRGQKAMASGLEKVHEVCPTQEESDRAIRPARWFVRKAPERLAGTFTCDKNTKQPHTFLFEMDKATLQEALKKNGYDTVSLSYAPDEQARTAATKKLTPPTSAAARAFDFVIKDFSEGFSFKNPKAKDAEQLPKQEGSKLTIRKFRLSNGVLQTMETVFKYDEAAQTCGAEKISINFEMWPPEVAAELATQDPLAELKSNLS